MRHNIDMTVSVLLKDNRSIAPVVTHDERLDDIDEFAGIRCPACTWRPSASSTWVCDCGDTPEPPFASCGTTWNTFATRGRCPGCRHQWQWTSCHRCGEASLHVSWYEDPHDA